jgi:hypothetical protein
LQEYPWALFVPIEIDADDVTMLAKHFYEHLVFRRFTADG